MDERGKYRFRLWYIAAIVPCLLIAAVATVRIFVRAKVNRRMEAIRATGEPVTFVELNDRYRLPEGENAADYITTGFTYLKLPEKQQQEQLPLFDLRALPLRSQRIDPKAQAFVVRVLADNKKALELLRKGAAIRDCRYPIDLSQGFSCFIPHLSPGLREATFLFVWEAILEAEQRHAEPAVQAILSAYGLAHSLQNEPAEVSQFLRVFFHGVTGKGLERVLTKSALDDAQLRRIDTALAAAYDPDTAVLPFVSRRCAVYEAFRSPRDPSLTRGTNEKAPSQAHVTIGRVFGTLDLSLLEYLDRVDQYASILELAPSERFKTIAEIERRYEAAPLPYPELAWLLDDLGRIARNNLEDMAQLRAARVAIAIERYRLANNRPPESLADLVPTYLDLVPTDPFDGQPLRYKKRSPGYVVYSIGPNGTDNGGAERQPKPRDQTQASPYDLTFIVER